VNKVGGADAVDNSMKGERKGDHFNGFVFGRILMFLFS